jgi:KipI family sensor histidine kinase inhibitor
MRFLPCGRKAVLVELDDLDEAMALAADLYAARPAGITELVPGARSVLIRFDAAHTSRQVIVSDVAARKPTRVARPSGRLVRLPVSYDGADLAEVARLAGMSTAEVVRRHTAATYDVAFTGFAPGFCYLSGGDPQLDVPRRQTPRTKVPAGTVALAGEFTGIYPREAPGGWQLIGRTDVTMWDLDRTPPALLTPTDRVKFEAVST